MMTPLAVKDSWLRTMAEGRVPVDLMDLATDRMAKGHWDHEEQDWAAVDHWTEALEERVDELCYLSGAVMSGRLTMEQGRIAAEMIGAVHEFLCMCERVNG